MKKAQKEEKPLSKSIEAFCNLVNSAQNDARMYADELERLDNMTQDYLHALELGDLDYRERAKIATKLVDIRRDRRKVKNMLEVLEPFTDFQNEKESKVYMDKLRKLLGATRSTEKKQQNRMYLAKAVNDTELFNKVNGINDGKGEKS